MSAAAVPSTFEQAPLGGGRPREACPNGNAFRPSCKKRTCPVCGPRWGRDWRKVMFVNLDAYDGPVIMVSITAPGAERLPWDEHHCAGRHTRGGQHNGKRGCRVEQRAAREWAETASRRYGMLRQACAVHTRRKAPRPVNLLERVWEPQKRGVPHLHLVLGAGSREEIEAAAEFVSKLKDEAENYDFGYVDARGKYRKGMRGDRIVARGQILKLISAEDASRYLSSYLVGRSKHKASIRESLTDPAIEALNDRGFRVATTCKQCEGSGKLNDHHGDEVDCIWCDGRGTRSRKPRLAEDRTRRDESGARQPRPRRRIAEVLEVLGDRSELGRRPDVRHLRPRRRRLRVKGRTMALVAKLYDLQTNLLSDISGIALEREMTRLFNGPRSFKITAPSGHSALTTLALDGFPNLRRGMRKLLVWEDGEIIFHGRIWNVERNGNGLNNCATLTAYDGWMELGYDGDDRAGRPVRDATGNFINPTFTTPISGGDLIYQVLTNSQGTDPEGGANPGEGPLPLDLTTGTFDTSIPPAVDLSCEDRMNWPVLIGDFINELVKTGVVDVDMRPIDPSEGLDPYAMCAVSAVNSMGTDRSATVHFDYWTGSRNAGQCRHLEDFGPINNKLYDYLGPRKDQSHWRANITPGSAGTTVDPSTSRSLYGEFMQIREFDTTGTESTSRPLFIALWNGEQGLRVEPRDLLYITPVAGSKALYTAPQDFDVGDLIAVNVGAAFGLSLAEAQRVHGYTKTWSREGVPRLSELLTSADPA